MELKEISSIFQVSGRFGSSIGRRPRISLSSRVSIGSRRGRRPMQPHFMRNIGYPTIGSHPTPPPHDVKIIKQTVYVNQNTNVLPGGQTRKSTRRAPNSNAVRPNIVNLRVHPLPGGRVQLPGSLSLRHSGRPFLPGLHARGQSSVRQGFNNHARLPEANNTNVQHYLQGNQQQPQGTGSAKNSNVNTNPTNIIIYPKNKKDRPIIIQTNGQLTLSKVRTNAGQTNIVISRNPSAASPNGKATMTTLKPGEDPPEPEELMNPM